MTEEPEIVNAEAPQAAPAPKKAWHAPVLEETSYTATEIAGIPGSTPDGYGNYSVGAP
jgi:hypothetical protein